MNRSLVFDLATCAFIGKREDALLLGPGGTGKSHWAQAIGQATIQQNYRVMCRETLVLRDDLAEAVAESGFAELPGRFDGYAATKVAHELRERRKEVDLTSTLTVLASVEAAFRIDYLQLLLPKGKRSNLAHLP